LYLLFTSRTIFPVYKKDGSLSGSHEQLIKNTYVTAAVDFPIWFVTLHTICIEWIMPAKWRTGVAIG
jgi:hypothetical protein